MLSRDCANIVHCATGSSLWQQWDIMPCQNNYLRSPLYLFASRVHCPLSISLGTKIAKETQRKPKLLYKTFLALLLCFTEWEMFFVLFLGFVNSLFCSASNIWTTLLAACNQSCTLNAENSYSCVHFYQMSKSLLLPLYGLVGTSCGATLRF